MVECAKCNLKLVLEAKEGTDGKHYCDDCIEKLDLEKCSLCGRYDDDIKSNDCGKVCNGCYDNLE